LAYVGDTVYFECQSHGFTKWNIWKRTSGSSKKLHRNAEVRNNMLIIRNVQHTNQGNYECQGVLDEYYAGSLDRVKFAARTTLAVRKCCKTTQTLKKIKIKYKK